jgi:hypothetical protein
VQLSSDENSADIANASHILGKVLSYIKAMGRLSVMRSATGIQYNKLYKEKSVRT